MAALIEVKYFNSFILRKTLGAGGTAVWGGSNANNTYPAATPSVSNDKNWAVEEARIRGGYNNVNVDYGAKAFLVDDNPISSIRSNALIYSGIFNSRTGINDTNVFSVAEDITKGVDPINGSIQKIFAEDTQLIIFQEKKVSRAPIDKDLIYSAEGSTTLTASNTVIGTINPYMGNYGISKNPESFAVYGGRKYFTDRDRNAVLRLSRDGLTEISNYGMIDFFRDEFGQLEGGKLIGGYDIYNKQYSLSIQPTYVGLQSGQPYKTLVFDEAINGWSSFFSYNPSSMLSLKSNFYSAGPSLTSDDGGFTGANGPNTAGLYQHYISTVPRCNFYGLNNKASVEFIFNPQVSVSKVFKTINYEGSNGWQVDSFVSDSTGISFPITDIDNYRITNTNDSTAFIYSFNESAYDTLGNTFADVSTTPVTQNITSLVPPLLHSGFTRKENKYMANLLNNSVAAPGEIIFGDIMTGIKGYFATVKMSTDTLTDPGGTKELFAASSEYVGSAY